MESLVSINVSNNAQLVSVPKSWGNLPGLKSLDASNCEKFVGVPYSVCAMESINKMLLTATALTRTGPPPEILDWSGQLGWQWGSCNKQERACAVGISLSPACKSALQNIRALNASGNNFTIAGGRDLGPQLGWIRWFQKLSRLDLSNNSISTVGTDFLDLVRGIYRISTDADGGVTLHSNPIQRVLLGGLSSVTLLVKILSVLRHNPLSEHLRDLKIKGIDLGNYTIGPGTDLNLRHLDLFGSGFRNLTFLELSGSSIGALAPGSFRNLPALRKLYLGECRLSDSDLRVGAFAPLKNLEKLTLFRNEFTVLEVGAFSDNVQLKVLELHENSLSTIAPGMLSSLPNLKILWLHENHITRIQTTGLSGLGNLDELKLHMNRLTALEVDFCAGLQNLRTLEISGNSISLVEPGAFSGCANVEAITMWPQDGLNCTTTNTSTWGLPARFDDGGLNVCT